MIQKKHMVKTVALPSATSSESADSKLKIYFLFHMIRQSLFAIQTLPPAVDKEENINVSVFSPSALLPGSIKYQHSWWKQYSAQPVELNLWNSPHTGHW